MFYKATNPKSGNMWDVWLIHHSGTYYLYSLCNADKGWDNMSMASSPDGVHWTEVGPVITKDDGVTWMGTGSTWKNPVPGAKPPFQINYSSWIGERQTIFFAQSDDLLHWTKCGKEKEFVQDERWYEPKGRWDCIWSMARPGGGLYGYWTATPKKETGGKFGFGESLDGITWTALQPPKVEGVPDVEGEVGAIEKVGSRYYMLFGNYPVMRALVADQPQGPFKAAAKNQVFLAGHTYFTRFFPSPSGLLVCHHSIARDGKVSAGLLKGTHFDAEGTMRLTWWPGNEALKHKPVAVPAPAAGGSGPIKMLGRKLDLSAGLVLEGKLKLPAPLGAPRGLYIEHGKGTGTAILFGCDGRAELGSLAADGSGFKADKTVDREMRFAEPARFRLVLEGVLLEIYLDDVLIECYSLPAPATGRIGLIPGSQRNSISALKAWK
jgi:hypothetical protein